MVLPLFLKQNSLNESIDGILEENRYFREELSSIKTLLKDFQATKPLRTPPESIVQIPPPLTE